LLKTVTLLPPTNTNNDRELQEDDEEEEIPEEIAQLEEMGRFSEVGDWGHEGIPSSEAEDGEAVLRGLGEWVGFAEKVSCLYIYLRWGSWGGEEGRE
jgi:hypothetical protein